VSLFRKKEPEPTEPRLTIERSANELRLRTEAHVGTWGLDEASWNADLDAGTIEFRNRKGMVITAPVQVVGTYNTEDGTWLWGWDHPSVPEPIAAHARLAKDFGERYGLEEYTTRKIECGEDLAWEFAAVACHLAGAQGAYRGPSGPTMVFMTFGTVTIAAA
jgi:hypothetical protein